MKDLDVGCNCIGGRVSSPNHVMFVYYHLNLYLYIHCLYILSPWFPIGYEPHTIPLSLQVYLCHSVSICACLWSWQGPSVYLCLSVPAHSLDRKLICVYLPAVPTTIKTLSRRYLYIIRVSIMALKTILTSITKLNGLNWHTWSKETEAYLTMEELWEPIDPTKPIPTSSTSLKCNKKAYMYIWFLVDPDCQDSIIKIKSG